MPIQTLNPEETAALQKQHDQAHERRRALMRGSKVRTLSDAEIRYQLEERDRRSQERFDNERAALVAKARRAEAAHEAAATALAATEQALEAERAKHAELEAFHIETERAHEANRETLTQTAQAAQARAEQAEKALELAQAELARLTAPGAPHYVGKGAAAAADTEPPPPGEG